MQRTELHNHIHPSTSDRLIQAGQALVGGVVLLFMAVIIFGQSVLIISRLGEIMTSLGRLLFGG